MTDNEIIRALECCGTGDTYADCEKNGCPLYLGITMGCKYVDKENQLYSDALDLINSQKVEIEQWKEEANEYQNLWCIAVDDIEKAKSEAIKEFAQRLKNAFPEGNRDNKCPAIYWDDYCYIIDECAEEMVGDNNAE